MTRADDMIRLLPVANTRALLAIDGPANATWNTVIQAAAAYEGPAGNAITLATANDGAGTGSFTVAGTAITFHFANGVTTVANFEAAILANATVAALIETKTAGTTQGYQLLTAGDVFSATNLTGGGATASAAPSTTSKTAYKNRPFYADEALCLVRSAAGSGTMTVIVHLWGWNEGDDLGHYIGALKGGDAIPEAKADYISYSELVVGIGKFSAFYAQLGTVGGTATEVVVELDFVRPSAH